MTVSVLVVDDSAFFRKRVCEILQSVSNIKVVGTASNGRDAVDLAKKLRPDVITMDYEMPVMDGVTAVRNIMQTCPTPVLMFSSLTYDGARVTLDALEAGAVDFLPKNFEDISRDASKMQEVLKKRILAIAKASGKPLTTTSSRAETGGASTAGTVRDAPSSRTSLKQPERSPAAGRPERAAPGNRSVPAGASNLLRNRQQQAASETRQKHKPEAIKHAVDIVAIGASTGGPIALQKVLTQLPANFSKPIVLIQHMPASFTPAFADRLNQLCRIKVKHAEDGDVIKPGTAYLAPGGMQMIIHRSGQQATIKVLEGDSRLHYKPCVDLTFGSIAKGFPGKSLGIVMTGMGADGREGCRLMKQGGATVWTQDEQSCVIYGMPMSVDKAGYSDRSITLMDIAEHIVRGIG